MARRSSVARELVALPWWVPFAVATLLYLGAKIILPALQFTNPVFIAMAGAVIALAPIGTVLLLALGCGLIVRNAVSSRQRQQLLARQSGIESVRGLSWDDFERIVGEIFRQRGYRVVENQAHGADRGIDLRLAGLGESIVVQCKHWNTNSVGVSLVRELLGVTVSEQATRGILVCSGTFTRSAKAFAQQNGIELIDGDELVALAGISSDTFSQEGCPRCGASMVQRMAKRGTNAGRSFMGCSRYPECRGIRDVA